MKVQAIKKICVAAKKIYILNTEDRQQWVGDGAGMYPVENIYLNKSNIFTIFDIEEKQAEKMMVYCMETDDRRIDIHPNQDAEMLLEQVGYPFFYAGNLLYALTGPDGIIMINSAYLKPAERGDGKFEFYLRRDEGRIPCVAVYADMLAGALITPFRDVLPIQAEFRKLCAQPAYDLAEEDGHDD